MRMVPIAWPAGEKMGANYSLRILDETGLIILGSYPSILSSNLRESTKGEMQVRFLLAAKIGLT